MSKAPPAFQFYPNDFVTGTSRFTTTEVGGYTLLLCEQWTQGSVPGDELKRLATIMRCTPPTARSIWKTISTKFVRGEDGQWRNDRLERVRAGRSAYTQTQSEKGTKGAEKRWPRLSPRPSEKDSSPISDLPSPKSTESQNDSVLDRPPRDLLAVHDRLFQERYSHKPPNYGAKEALIAKNLIKQYGFDGASQLVEAFFASRDSWIQQTGHAFGPLASNTTQTKLIAEMSGHGARNDGRDWAREFIRG